MEKWYNSVHSNTASIIQIGGIPFIIVFGSLLGAILYALNYFVDDLTEYIIPLIVPFIIFTVLIPSIIALMVAKYVVSIALYQIHFSETGITVRTKIYSKENKFHIAYKNIQFIQHYTKNSTVRNSPKMVIVVDENSKYEVTLINDREVEELAVIIPPSILKKIM